MANWTISDLAVAPAGWWDAADTASLTLSGSSVTQWNDKSGGARHATQTTVAQQPTSGGSTLNARNLVTMLDDQWMNLPALGISGTQARSAFSVTQAPADGTNRGTITIGAASGSGARWSFRTASGKLRIEVGGGGYTSSYDALAAGIQGISFDGTTLANHTMWLNGVPEAATGTNAINTNDVDNRIGIALTNAPTGTRHFGEIVLLGYTPTTDERQKIEGYLAHKWGLTAGLPANHPYKTEAPQTAEGNTGAITAPTPALSGSGSLERKGAGAVSAPTSTVAGSGKLERKGSGAISATTPIVDGSSQLTVTGSGAISASVSVVSGSGNLGLNGSGIISASTPTVDGSATILRKGSGVIVSTAPSVAGSGNLGLSGRGAIAAPASALSGSGKHTLKGSGAVASTAPVVGGSGSLERKGSGVISAPAPTVDGSSQLTVRGSGAAVAPSAKVTGSGQRIIGGIAVVTSPLTRIDGTGQRVISGSSSISGTPAILEGSGQRSLDGAGVIVATAARVFGIGQRTITGQGVTIVTSPRLWASMTEFSRRRFALVGAASLNSATGTSGRTTATLMPRESR